MSHKRPEQIDPRRPIPASGYDRLRDNISANIQIPGAKSVKFKEETLKRL